MRCSARLSIRISIVILAFSLAPLAAQAPGSAAVPAGFAFIPGGDFDMGSPAEDPQRLQDESRHGVALRSFAMAALDVTAGEFRAFAEAAGYRTSAELEGRGWVHPEGKDWEERAGASWRNPGYPQAGDHPVVLVSWYDAVAYCNWRSLAEGRKPAYACGGVADFGKWPAGWNTGVRGAIVCDFSAEGYRLPTEAEWEYAAKGGPASAGLAPGELYAGSADLDAAAWRFTGADPGTHPVGRKRPNALGLYDMAGNVWQWCHDWYGEYEFGIGTMPVDPRGPAAGEGRVLRGGSWDEPLSADFRSTMRRRGPPGARAGNIGFRLACTVAAPPTPPVAIGFVAVPGGEFTMGSPEGEAGRRENEGPPHRVRLSAFSMSTCELTFDEYDAFCAATGRAKPDDGGWGRGRRPVVGVSWRDAIEYCNWRSTAEGLRPCYSAEGRGLRCDFAANGYRLPTEAEWEYAARGGPAAKDPAPGAAYAGSAILDWVAWYCGNAGGVAQPVGEKAPNALGLRDLAGNVWELCWDRYGEDYYGASPAVDPQGPPEGEGRVVRGGGFYDRSLSLRSTARFGLPEGSRGEDLGFRIVKGP